MTECKKCGKCCEAIALTYNKDIINLNAATPGNDPSWKFAKRNFIEISKEEALEINPYLKSWNKNDIIFFYYKCKQYCNLTKTCIVHSIRTGICSDFPYYGRNKLKKGEKLYSKNCAFQKDIKK